MTAILSFLGRQAGIALALGLFVGVAFPFLARWSAPLLLPSIVLLLVAALVRLDAKAVFRHVRRPFLALAALAWFLVLSPILMALAVTAIQPAPMLAAAMVLAAACPPVISAIAFAHMFRLDAPLATVLVYAAIYLVPFTLPPLALWLLGISLPIEPWALTLRLAAITLGSLALAVAIRAAIARAELEKRRDMLDGIAVAGLLVFAVAIMDGVTDAIGARPVYVLWNLLAVFGASIGLQIAAYAVFWWAGRERALTLALASGNRNKGLLLAAMAGAAPFDITLYLAMGQVPIYLAPLLLRPLYSRLLGPPPPRSS